MISLPGCIRLKSLNKDEFSKAAAESGEKLQLQIYTLNKCPVEINMYFLFHLWSPMHDEEIFVALECENVVVACFLQQNGAFWYSCFLP